MMTAYYLLTGVPLYLFLLIGPVSGVAIIVALMPQKTIEERIQTITKACWIAYGTMMFFAITGSFFLGTVLCVSREAFQIGGGLYLLILSIDMLGLKSSPNRKENDRKLTAHSDINSTLYITPIAIPLITGPGVIAAILTFRSQIEGFFDGIFFLLSLSMTMMAVFICFYLLIKTSKLLTPKILHLIERLAGLLTACLALDIVIGGMKIYFSNL
ncbi:MAG: MarC family protein [Puniceicoccales bacterium]|jgi:multiple antibiotic resistance protein|nr:MarC family protein [Puniceicoccales bacterium]